VNDLNGEVVMTTAILTRSFRETDHQVLARGRELRASLNQRAFKSV